MFYSSLKMAFKSLSILKHSWKWVEKIIFYKHYQLSHRHYLERKYERPWRELSNNIMYDLNIKDIYCNDKKVASSKIYLKLDDNKNDDVTIDFLFIAQCDGLDYIQHIIHHFIPCRIAVLSLTNIPIKEIRVINDKINLSLGTYYFHINQIILNEKCVKKDAKSLNYHPTYFEELNGQFVEKWGTYWNMSLYKRAMENFSIEIAGAFLEDAILSYKMMVEKPSFYLKLRLFFVRTLQKDRCIRFLFWSSLILNLAKVTTNTELKSKYFSMKKCQKFLRLKQLTYII